MGLLDFLFKPDQAASTTDDSDSSSAIRKIADELSHMDPDKARYVASFAYILGRVAHADLEISDEEIRCVLARQRVRAGGRSSGRGARS